MTDIAKSKSVMVAMNIFEKVAMIAILVFAIFVLWYCALRNSEANPQPTSYTYEGDTVATEDDHIDQLEGDKSIGEDDHHEQFDHAPKSSTLTVAEGDTEDEEFNVDPSLPTSLDIVVPIAINASIPSDVDRDRDETTLASNTTDEEIPSQENKNNDAVV